MKVALISTVKNEVKQIEAFLGSIQAQTRLPEEIIIVDGGSLDNTVQKLEFLKASIPALKILIKPGCNISQGRNIAINATDADLIAVSDVGCKLDQDWLAEIVQPLETNQADLVAGLTLPLAKNDFEKCAGATILTLASDMHEDNFLPTGRNMAFRKALWEELSRFPEWLYTGEDTRFSLAARKAGFEIAVNKNALVRWQPRSSLKAIFKQFYLYGRGNARSFINFLIVAKMALKYALWLSLISILIIFPHWSIWLVFIAAVSLYVKSSKRYISQHYKLPSWQNFFTVQIIWRVKHIAEILGYFQGLLDRCLNSTFRQPIRKYPAFLMVSLLDLDQEPHHRAHRIYKALQNKFKNGDLFFKERLVSISKLDLIIAFFGFQVKKDYTRAGCRTKVAPWLSHTESLGLTWLGYPEAKKKEFSYRKHLQRILRFFGSLSELSLVPSFFLAFLLSEAPKYKLAIGEGPWAFAFCHFLKKLGYVEKTVYEDIDYVPGFLPDKFRKGYTAWLEKYLLRKADLHICTGNLLASRREKETGSKAVLIPNGVDYDLFSKAQEKPPHPPTLIYTGNIADYAGMDLIILALPEIIKIIPDLGLKIVGRSLPNYLKYLKDLAGKNKVLEKIEFLEPVPYQELPQLLSKADLGLACSKDIELRRFAFPYKVIEYMAAGLAVLVTEGSEAAELVKLYQCGIISKDEPNSLAKAIIEFFKDARNLAKMQKNAIQAAQNYQWDKLLTKEMSAIDSIFNKDNL